MTHPTSHRGEMFRHVAFPFPDGCFPPQLGAVVQLTVLDGLEPAREVIHSADNSWLIGDGINDPNLDCSSIATHIRHVVELDPTLEDLATLPLDHIATRNGADHPWHVAWLEWADEP